MSEPRSSLSFAVSRCQANVESRSLKFVEWVNGVAEEFVPGRPKWAKDPVQAAGLTPICGLVEVVERFDVLVQLLIHPRGLVGVGNNFDISSAGGVIRRLEGVVKCAAVVHARGEPPLAAQGMR